jgi:hypothetical protein
MTIGGVGDTRSESEQYYFSIAVAADVVELVGPLVHALEHLRRTVQHQLASALWVFEQQCKAAQEAAKE